MNNNFNTANNGNMANDNNSPIVLEIIPTYFPFKALLYLNTPDTRFKFIEIKEDKRQYFHIYFEGQEGEINRDYLTNNDNVKKIKVVIDYPVTSLEYLFFECQVIESVNFINFSRDNITNMKGLFYGCRQLKEVNFGDINTINVNDMSSMFYECESLKKIELSKFNTSNVTNMSYMFCGCRFLNELNLSNFIINDCCDMSCMFEDCSNELKSKISQQNNRIKI